MIPASAELKSALPMFFVMLPLSRPGAVGLEIHLPLC